MPPLPIPPAPRPLDAPAHLPFARNGSEPRFAIDIPRYFVDVRVPGYDVAKTVARARKRQQQALARECESAADECSPPGRRGTGSDN